MVKFFKRASQIEVIIALRNIAIVIQLLLIIFINLNLAYQTLLAALNGSKAKIIEADETSE
jgi:hypothetical protein